jgi:uncharacterized circularly permuted ATP-grasp superfamily protein
MTIEDEIYEIDNNPTKVVNDKIDELILACSKIPNSAPKKSGNKTMYQHLQDMKRHLETDPTNWLADEKARLEQALIDRDNEVLV